jgi:hypothetical protein
LAANRSQPGFETPIGLVPFVPGDPVNGHENRDCRRAIRTSNDKTDGQPHRSVPAD